MLVRQQYVWTDSNEDGEIYAGGRGWLCLALAIGRVSSSGWRVVEWLASRAAWYMYHSHPGWYHTCAYDTFLQNHTEFLPVCLLFCLLVRRRNRQYGTICMMHSHVTGTRYQVPYDARGVSMNFDH